MKILIVENCEDDAILLTWQLRRLEKHLELVVVGTVWSAMEAVLDNGYDVLVVDLDLPDAKGVEAVSQLRRAFPDIPLVVLTGQSCPEIALRAHAEGIDEYLVKGKADSSTIYSALVASRVRHSVRRTTDLYPIVGFKGNGESK